MRNDLITVPFDREFSSVKLDTAFFIYKQVDNVIYLTIKLLLLLLLLPKVVTGLVCDNNKILEFLNFNIDTFGKYNTQKWLLLLSW